MASCSHVQWLRLHQEQRVFNIQDGNRLHNMMESLPRPFKQFPSVVFFLGKTIKAVALRGLYPETRLSTSRHHGIANICIDPESRNDDHPIMVADGYQEGTATINTKEYKCHETMSHVVDWQESSEEPPQRQSMVHLINARLLSLFIDVICIFAEDYGGLAGVVTSLTKWAAYGSASCLPKAVRPRIVVVTRISGEIFDSEVLRFRSQLFSTPRFSEVFSSLNVVNLLPKLRPTSQTDFSALKQVLDQELQASRFARIDSSTLFSSAHMDVLFKKALGRFVKTPEASFDFIRASRDENPVNADLQSHIGKFMSLSLDFTLPDSIPLPFIASAILMDSFPPDMHQFNPSQVFRVLYKPHVLRGIKEFAESRELASELICIEIESQMLLMYSQMGNENKSALTIRQDILHQLKPYSSQLKTLQVCIYCSSRKYEHVFSCGHKICDVCVAILGKRSKGQEYHFDISTCCLCETEINFQAKLLPPTCGIRFISFDGGGSRGIVQLEYLNAFQDELGLSYPLQEHFDYGIGTSIGGVVVLTFFEEYWDIKKCLKFFPQFIKSVFPSKKGIKRSILQKTWMFLASCFADGRYNAESLETLLKATFGSRPLFGTRGRRPSGMKIAVTATTISDATLCLLSNYNGAERHSKDFRCKHLRASNASDEILIWEAARCTTAAPWYFKPKFLKAFGTFQDGGLKNNNPVKPGMDEVRQIWKDRNYDIVLSMGTGFREQVSSPVAPNVRNLFQDGTLARLYRASMSSLSLDGGNSWKDHWSGLEKETKGQHFRLDLPLKGKEPALDDVDQMPELQRQVRRHLGDLKGLARAFKAVSFFFELDEPMIREGVGYRCRGSILSRSPNSRALQQNLALEFPYAQFLINDETLGFLAPVDICQECGRFQKAVTFLVRHPHEVANLCLMYNRLYRRSISGFPHSMKWFEDRQMFTALFGRADHTARIKQESPSDCSCIQNRITNIVARVEGRKRALSSVVMRRSQRNCH